MLISNANLMSVGVKAALELECIRNDRQGHQATSTLEAEPEGEPKRPQQCALQFFVKRPHKPSSDQIGSPNLVLSFSVSPFLFGL